jgi:DmsE family decaheme c-type cytochrome
MVGTQTCATCHEDQAKGLGQNTHGRLAAGAVPCESCHGPGQAHVDGGGDKTKILNPAKADAAKVSAQCLTCHDKQEGRRFFVGGAHAAEGLSCVSCHGIHSPKKVNRGLLRDGSSTALCLTCHANKEKSLFMRSRHPLREGKMECVSCHDPHGTPTRAMLKAASPNELCFKCHAEMRGPYMFSHSPVVENCMNCHNPHGTNQENMLVRRETRLCQSCHLEGKHQTLSGQVNDTWDSYRMCTNCHVNIHGSNHPSGYKFLR